MGVQTNLYAPRLTSRVLKLMTMQASSGHHISNHVTWTWNHIESKPLSHNLLPLNYVLDGETLLVLYKLDYIKIIYRWYVIRINDVSIYIIFFFVPYQNSSIFVFLYLIIFRMWHYWRTLTGKKRKQYNFKTLIRYSNLEQLTCLDIYFVYYTWSVALINFH
jgi:hypothetical protein